jgi:hypothetical protein
MNSNACGLERTADR